MTSFLEIHTIAGAIVNSHFGDALTNRPDIARISGGQPLDTNLYAGSRLDITQTIEPLDECIGFAYFDHGLNVATWIHPVKRAKSAPKMSNAESSANRAKAFCIDTNTRN